MSVLHLVLLLLLRDHIHRRSLVAAVFLCLLSPHTCIFSFTRAVVRVFFQRLPCNAFCSCLRPRSYRNPASCIYGLLLLPKNKLSIRVQHLRVKLVLQISCFCAPPRFANILMQNWLGNASRSYPSPDVTSLTCGQ